MSQAYGIIRMHKLSVVKNIVISIFTISFCIVLDVYTAFRGTFSK